VWVIDFIQHGSGRLPPSQNDALNDDIICPSRSTGCLK
jgi:hypothetical protein